MHRNANFIKDTLPHAHIEGTLPQSINFSIDSRTVTPGDLFVALRGQKVDGHEFIKDALEKGAYGFIVSHEKLDLARAQCAHIKGPWCIISVADPFNTLIELARAWRAQFNIPVIGITGSIGKTSTKQTLAHIMDCAHKRYIVSAGNQNTLLGAALTLLKIRSEHELAIIEMGISKRGEMAQLARLVQPTTAIITGVGHSHMEGLGSICDIAQEKRDIFKYFKEDSIGIVNGDNPLLASVGYMHPVIKFGTKTINQVQARKIQISSDRTTFILKLYRQKFTVNLLDCHEGRIFHTLASIAAAHLIGIPIATVLSSLEKLPVVAGRYERRAITSGGYIINDSYNASPESMKAALLALEKIDTFNIKGAVLGDMKELGVNSAFWHRQLGRFLRKVPSLAFVILVGDMVKWTRKTMPVNIQVFMAKNWQEAVALLQPLLTRDCVVLVKGSRSVALDQLVNTFAPAIPDKIITKPIEPML